MTATAAVPVWAPHPPFFAAYAHAHRTTPEEMRRDIRPATYLRWLRAQRDLFRLEQDGEELPDEHARFEAWLTIKHPATLVTV